MVRTALLCVVLLVAPATAAVTGPRQSPVLSDADLIAALPLALARAANLSAVYQTVVVPPTWTSDGQVVVANHVNALVRRDRGAALAHLRAAADAHPDVVGMWVNLGVLYARERRYGYAEAAYLRAIEVDPAELSALSNLVHVYTAIDEPELAAHYGMRVQSYRERNPYYHFPLAAEAYEQQRPMAALAAVRKALKLERDDADFHTLQGRAFETLGRSRDAARSFERARSNRRASTRSGGRRPRCRGDRVRVPRSTCRGPRSRRPRRRGVRRADRVHRRAQRARAALVQSLRWSGGWPRARPRSTPAFQPACRMAESVERVVEVAEPAMGAGQLHQASRKPWARPHGLRPRASGACRVAMVSAVARRRRPRSASPRSAPRRSRRRAARRRVRTGTPGCTP